MSRPAWALVALWGLLLASPGCAAPGPWTASRPGGGETLTVCLPTEPASLDPAQAAGRSEWRVAACMFETLVRPGPAPGEVEPGLALSWESGQGGRRWTFSLRPGVRFHDGRALTAALAVEALGRPWRRGQGSLEAARQLFPFAQGLLGGAGASPISLSAAEEMTLVLELGVPLASLLEILAHPPMALALPAREGGEGQEAWVGTGPFRLRERRPGQRVILEAWEGYWGGAPSPGRIVFTALPEARARARELVRGNVELAAGLDPSGLEDLRRAGGGALVTRSRAWDGLFLAMNCSRPPWADIRTRLALHHLTPALGGAARGFLPPGSWALAPQAALPPLDPGWGRRLLGRVRGLSAREAPTLLYSAPCPALGDASGLARQLAQVFEPLGVTVTPTPLAPDELRRRLETGSYELALAPVQPGLTDPDLILFPLWARENASPVGTNWSRYRSGRLQEWLDRGRTSLEWEHRRAACAEVQQQLARAMPAVPLLWTPELLGVDPALEGVRLDRLGLLDLSRARLGGPP